MVERDWLQYIADVAYDRDGYKSALDLGELVDELRALAIRGLDGEMCPIPATHSQSDKDWLLNPQSIGYEEARKEKNKKDEGKFWKEIEQAKRRKNAIN